jgi:hypothetical protein
VEQVLLPVLAARPVEQAVLLHGAGRHWEAGVFSDLPRGIPVPIPPGERCELFIKSKAEIEKAESRNGIPLRRLVNSLRFHNFCFLLFAFCFFQRRLGIFLDSISFKTGFLSIR